jgi:DsbC/DsbD-like thiol-disulfide interchange protein
MHPKMCLTALFLLLLTTPAFSQNLSHVKVELLAEPKSVQSGGSVTLGFHFHLKNGWHIYWQNPGDSGQAPSITWTLPEGFTAGDIFWPTPQRITLPSLADYGYTNEVLLMVPIQAPDNLKPGHFVRFSAHIRWLVCNEICIPGDMSFNVRLAVKKHKPVLNSRHEYLFQSARRSLPADMPEDWKASGSLGKKEFHIVIATGAPLAKTATALFIPLHPNQIENAPAQVFKTSGGSIQLAVKKSDQLAQDVKSLDGVLVVKDKKSTKGYNVTIPLSEE